MNVLVYALAEDVLGHDAYRSWLDAALVADVQLAVTDLALSGFLRITTNPKITRLPASIEAAVAPVEALRSDPRVVVLGPGPRHWAIFRDLCVAANAKGNLVADAYHAAIAIEHDAEFITTDGDYARFPRLRWRHPLRS